LAYLRTQHPTLPFRASSAFLPVAEPAIKSRGKEKAPVNDAIGASSIFAYLSKCAQEKEGDEPVAVAIVGLTNVSILSYRGCSTNNLTSLLLQAGKSSLINSLLEKAVLPIYSLSSSSLAPSTTCLAQEVTLPVSGKQIRLIDTPGLSWMASSDESTDEHDILRARDILLRNKGRIDRLRDPAFACSFFWLFARSIEFIYLITVAHIVSRADTEDLMLFYNLPAFLKGDKNAFLSGIARSNGMVKKVCLSFHSFGIDIVLRMCYIGWSA
jgi:nuclear GTP-binding protein